MYFQLSRDELLIEKEEDFNFYKKLMKYENKLEATKSGRVSGTFENIPNFPKEGGVVSLGEEDTKEDRFCMLKLRDVKGAERFEEVCFEWDEDWNEYMSTESFQAEKDLEHWKGQDLLAQRPAKPIEIVDGNLVCEPEKVLNPKEYQEYFKEDVLQKVKANDAQLKLEELSKSQEKEFGRGGIVPKDSLCPQIMADEIHDQQKECMEDLKDWTVVVDGLNEFQKVFDTLEYVGDVKVKVTPDQNERLQNELFLKGYKWYYGDKKFKYSHAHALDINSALKTITCWETSLITFMDSPSTEVVLGPQTSEFRKIFAVLDEGEDVKVKVTPEQSKKLQNELFVKGYTWMFPISGSKDIEKRENVVAVCIYNEIKEIGHWCEITNDSFKLKDATEVIL